MTVKVKASTEEEREAVRQRIREQEKRSPMPPEIEALLRNAVDEKSNDSDPTDHWAADKDRW
jgi:hypothetical protein